MDATKSFEITLSSVELDEIISRGPIIVFDALCVMCSTNAQFVLRHDHQHRFRLASMQEPVGIALYRRSGIDPADPETMIVVEQGRVLRNSDAVLAIYSGLDWPWRLAGLFKPCHVSSAIRSIVLLRATGIFFLEGARHAGCRMRPIRNVCSERPTNG